MYDHQWINEKRTLQVATAVTAANGARILYKKMTNEEARKAAKKLNMKEIKGKQGKKPNNDLIFERNGKYYSPDRDQHCGSIWKLLDPRTKRRIASCDKNLNVIKK